MKSWQQLISTAGVWLRENPGTARIIGVLTIVILAFSVIGSGNWWSPKAIALFDSRNLTKDELGLMQVAFGKSGLNEYEVQEGQIIVPKATRADYLKSLADHGAVPLDLNSTIEADSSFDFFQTRAQQRNRQITRKKQTIRDMVMQLRFVQRAIVDYDETAAATPFDPMQRTAIVNVTPATSRALEASEVKAIRDTVCGAVAGLHAEQITIIDTFASKSHTGLNDDTVNAMQPYARTQMQAERKYESKIRSALTAYPGIRVNVEVTVDPVTHRIRDERSVDGDSVVVSRTIQTDSAGRIPSTRAKFATQKFGIGANGQAKVQLNPALPNRSTEFTESISSGTYETTETAGNVVTNVSVSIGVPERCVRFLAKRDSDSETALSSDEIRNQHKQVMDWLDNDIRTKVGPLLPRSNAAAPQQQIVVTMDREIVFEEAVAPNRAKQFLSANWPYFAILTFGFWAFLLLRSSNPKTSPTTGAASREPISNDSRDVFPIQVASDSTNQSSNTNHSTAPDEPSSQKQMRVQLDQWCRDNPDAAAATIRQWLDKAG